MENLYNKSLKRRPKIEYIGEFFIRPIAFFVIKPLIQIRFKPHYLIFIHTIMGVFAGYLIALGNFYLSALLIVVKTILDAADGQLARATNQVSGFGRYLDSEGDLLVNFALFLGLGFYYQQMVFSLFCFLAFTLILSLDYNLEFLYQQCRGEEFRKTEDSDMVHKKTTVLLKAFYDLFFGFQDKLIRTFLNARFNKFYPENNELRSYFLKIYHEEIAILILTNMGLAGQMFLLSALLILGIPNYFLYCCIFFIILVISLQVYRELRLNYYLKNKQ
jgi:archaetidylinositol phosphate synthase